MKRYFTLVEKIEPDTAFAYTEGKTPMAFTLIPQVKTKTELPFDLILRNVTIEKHGLQADDDLSKIKHLWLDYQPNNLAWPLMSEKMKDIIDARLTGREGIKWIKARVRSKTEQRGYFIPCFQHRLDVLDEKETLYVEGTSLVMRPVFSLTKIAEFSMFYTPQDFWEISFDLSVTEELKRDMEKEKLTGVDFEQSTVV